MDSRGGQGPLPEDATARGLAAAVGEDLGRQLVGRLSLFAAALCVLAGVTTDADPALRGVAVGVGGGGFALVSVAALAQWQRRQQWLVILPVLLAAGGMLALVLAGHAGGS